MALPSSGQLSSLDVIQEREGDGFSPSSEWWLNAQQAQWSLPETPDDTDIWYGKGRPEGNTRPADSVTSNAADIHGEITNAGGYSGIDCDYRWRWKEQGTSGYNHTTIQTVSGTNTGIKETIISGLSPNTTYVFNFQLRNIHDNNSWQTFGERSFTTDSGPV